ncbi:MAG TPA: ABC transporter ATP-binding protein [Xanthobacteraceae bacterium]|jgi:NitT/TauT family transport system ATP-binding protein|nr:ABC transporter ATP-binding protein [Xanthobacteraceae bacterium]
MNADQVVLSGVSKSYKGKPVLGNLNLSIPRNKFTVVIGPSGCGKSTIINLIAGYDKPDAGTIMCDGKQVEDAKWDRLVVFQETALFPWKTTLENVAFGPTSQGAKKDEVATRARAIMEKFGLAGFEDKYPNQLSGGMQRRAELARAIINTPNVMLMDEPFRGLDAMTRELMQEYLLKLFEENHLTTLFVTSDIEEGIYLADTLIVLSSTPTSVRAVIDVGLPRPRNIRMLATARFGEVHKEVLQNLTKRERETTMA